MLDEEPSPPRDPSMGPRISGGSHVIHIAKVDDALD